jgi:6-phosphofructokinase 1
MVCTTPTPYARARKAYSALQHQRLKADCRDFLPAVLEQPPAIKTSVAEATSAKDVDTIRSLFPATCDTPLVQFVAGTADGAARKAIKVGVVLSGGQAPGGHNVIAGIFDGIKQWHKDSEMVGFLDGPHGVMNGNFVEITPEIMDGFRNTGGFDMLGSGRHKIETDQQFTDSLAVCQGIKLDGLVVIGGDDSNTNGALLAEYFKSKGSSTKVIGAPKTIDGDLKCPPHLPISFGFDTACRTYANQTANVAVDALSAQKYYHLVRLMGRSASNIALEVALITRPNICLLGEVVEQQKQSLQDITVDIANMVEERSKLGKDYGVIVVPEGLIEFIPEFNTLVAELNDKVEDCGDVTEEKVVAMLSPASATSFKHLPSFIRAQLLLDRDPHGNVQVSKIETEKLIAATVEAELEERRKKGTYKGKFSTQFHSYGYEGRAGMPTLFDSSYCYALGATAANLVANELTGLIASVKNLLAPPKEWECGGVPVTSLCVIERRKGKNKPVIRKALVELDGPLSQPYKAFTSIADKLRLTDSYRIPGPIQYDAAGCPTSMDIPITLQLELGKPLEQLMLNPKSEKMGKFIFAPQPLNSRSELQQWRTKREHRVPDSMKDFDLAAYRLEKGVSTKVMQDVETLEKHFTSVDAPVLKTVEVNKEPSAKRLRSRSRSEEDAVKLGPQKIGVVFCGRQAPGYHDLLSGLIDMIGSSGSLVGIVGGTLGLFDKHSVVLTKEMVKACQGSGGLELLGRTVDQIGSVEEREKARLACAELKLTGLVLVGGTRTHTDAAYLSEYFLKKGQSTAVVGVPFGIEGSMANDFVEASVGFDSSAKAMASLVGNTCVDGSSARKYYYFLKMMDGSSTGGKTPSSHIALEVALLTKPNLLILTEEVDDKRMSLRDVVDHVATIVEQRAAKGKNFGTIIVAEGLLAAIPEFRNLLSELADISSQTIVEVLPQLTGWSKALFETLPAFIQQQLMKERQSNAEMQLGQLDTAQLIADLVEVEMKARAKKGTYKGNYSSVSQYFGYQARCSMPSDFDSDYAYTLGGTAALLAAAGKSGYMAIVSDLAKPVEEWKTGGVPFTAMMKVDPVLPHEITEPLPRIFAECVDLKGNAFASWCKVRGDCAKEEMYENPGPIQLSGSTASTACNTIATRFSYVEELGRLSENIEDVASKCRPGCDARKLRVATQSLTTLNVILDELSGPLMATTDEQ